MRSKSARQNLFDRTSATWWSSQERNTTRSTTTARPGDWLLRAPGGELLICPVEVFDLMYEPA